MQKAPRGCRDSGRLRPHDGFRRARQIVEAEKDLQRRAELLAQTDEQGYTPFLVAVWKGTWQCSPPLLRLAQDHRAGVRLTRGRVTHRAGQIHTVKWLVAHENVTVDVRAKTADQMQVGPTANTVACAGLE